jgi:GNAT superfamily N-acetyltransferase
MPRSLAGLREIEDRHPTAPHWYLSVLGTDPTRQGEGLGSALLRPVLDDCDRLEIPAYLETGTERNVQFYTRHGFRVTERIELPGGPSMWLMWREPR